MTIESRERFADLCRNTDGLEADFRLDLALLLVAAEAHTELGDLDVFLARETARLDALAEQVPAHGRDDQLFTSPTVCTPTAPEPLHAHT